jgi:mannan endo-1,4-beta-mannosidase
MSARWLNIVNDKPAAAGALSLNPSLNDNVVYIDEELNFLVKKYGKASSAKGVKGYELDNEPDLWHVWPSSQGAGTTKICIRI